MAEAPELLTVESLRDFVIGLPHRDRWISLGVAYCPGQLMAEHARTLCTVYGQPLENLSEDDPAVPAEILTLNQRFFCTVATGLSPRQRVWELGKVSNLPWPTLWSITHKDWCDLHCNRILAGKRLGELWWSHPARRRYARLIVVPGDNL